MRKHKLSPWFDENTKPVNPGVYKTKAVYNCGMLNGWSLCIGKKWSYTCNTKEEAAISEGISRLQDKQWQGIVK